MTLIVHNSKETMAEVVKRRFCDLLGIDREAAICKTYEDIQKDPGQIHGYSQLILAGGSHIRHRSDKSGRESLGNELRAYAGPVLGVCYGSQLLAGLMGGGLAKLPQPKNGLFKAHVVSVMSHAVEKYSVMVYKSQLWTIQNVSDEFIMHIVSEDGVELFESKSKPWIGIGFHPEMYTKHQDAKAIIRGVMVGTRFGEAWRSIGLNDGN